MSLKRLFVLLKQNLEKQASDDAQVVSVEFRMPEGQEDYAG